MQVLKMDKHELSKNIKNWGAELGFQQIGIAATELHDDEMHLVNWLSKGRHGEMSYMMSHGTKRSRPNELLPGTISIICARMDYFPPSSKHPAQVLKNKNLAYISRYATGRDYHKLIRQRLKKLATKINSLSSEKCPICSVRVMGLSNIKYISLPPSQSCTPNSLNSIVPFSFKSQL